MNPINNGGRPPRDNPAPENGATSTKAGATPSKSSASPARLLPAGTPPFHASAATALIVTRLALSPQNTGARRSSALAPADKQLTSALEEHRAYQRQIRKREGNAG